MRTRSGTKHLPTSRIFSPSARPTSTTRRQTADLRARHMSVTTHPPAALPPPTPRVTSFATSTSRAWRNHLHQLRTTHFRHNHTHTRTTGFRSRHASINQTSRATQAAGTGSRSHGAECNTHGSTLQGWRRRRRCGQRRRQTQSWRQQQWQLAQKPMEREKTLPQLQQGGHP